MRFPASPIYAQKLRGRDHVCVAEHGAGPRVIPGWLLNSFPGNGWEWGWFLGLVSGGADTNAGAHMRLILATFIGMVFGLTGCTDAILDGIGGSGGDFSISIDAGISPLYSWGAGPAFSLDVVRTANQSIVVWRITNPNTRNITSPVRHGTVPTGALESVGTERTLTRGIEYRATITLADGRSAFRDFRP